MTAKEKQMLHDVFTCAMGMLTTANEGLPYKGLKLNWPKEYSDMYYGLNKWCIKLQDGEDKPVEEWSFKDDE